MKPTAKKGDWVQIYQQVLAAEKRAPQLPPDTRKVPLEMMVAGFLVDPEAELGETVTIQTVIGRNMTGILQAIGPKPTHDYGRPVPELLTVGAELREILRAKGA